MEVKVTKTPKSEVALEIEISAEETRPYLEKAARQLAKEIKFEGFREGKAPFDVVRQKVGDQDLLKEALELLIPEKLHQAIVDNKLEIAAQPKVDILKLATGNPVVFKAVCAIMPEVALGDYAKVEIKREKAVVAPEKAEQVLMDIRKMRATEVAVTREAQKSDKLVVDIDMNIDKVPLDGGQGRNTVLILGEDHLLPGLDEQLVGLKPEAEKEFTLPYPADHYDKKLAGKKVDFKVAVKSVFEIKLPELNDEFVKNLGGFKNVDKLKDKIKENLELEAAEKLERKLETKVFDTVVEKTSFGPIPHGLIERELDKMLRELADAVGGQGMKFEDYLIQLKKSQEDLKEEFAKPAEKRIKISLALRELIKEKELKVGEKEIDDEVEELLKNCRDDEETKKRVQSKDYRLYIEDVLLNRKAVDELKKLMVKD